MKRLTAILLLASALAACEHSATSPDEREPSASRVIAAATFRVNSTADAVDAQPGNGVCRTAAGVCTLRAAIQEANARAGADVITVPAGTYALTLNEPADDGIGGGDLDITDAVQITGAGAARTLIDGGERPHAIVTVLRTGTGRVVIAKLTLQNGGTADETCPGGGLVVGAGRVLLQLATVRNSVDYCSGGGIRNRGNLTVDRSVVTGNLSNAGGGISNDGTLLVTRSTVSYNWAEDWGGGISNYGTMTLVNSTVSGNASVYGAGGIRGGGTLNNVTITRNYSGYAVGGLQTSGNTVMSNTIISANNNEYGPSDCGGTIQSAGYNLILERRGCTLTGNLTGNIYGIAPKLGALANNGGPTPTHALLAGSPAINKGNPAAPGTKEPLCILKDQREKPRGRTRCDIGSFEVQ